ncbi:general stress protein [Tumidithrix elongata RA019]|uniref:General stress protein n=1 Tax=Tumidithrix elongata BACA0141 TaxID=2716417 RepID=A0AAW9Q1N9_9CYAN|nr:general stress protein [Tumidithrix elongata RA019]
MTNNKRAVGIFSGYQEAEDALTKLRCAGFAMNQVSIVAKDSDVNEATHFDEEAKIGAEAGGAVGGLTGLLVGLGILSVPGVGLIMLAGTTASAIATTLAGGAIGTVAGSLVGGLIGLGIPEDQAQIYHDYVVRGDYLVIVDGTDAEILGAGTILRRRGIREWEVYPPAIARRDIEPSCSLMKS